MNFELLNHNGTQVSEYNAESWFLVPFPREKGRPFNADNLATANLSPFLDDDQFQNALKAASNRWSGTGMERDISWRVHIFLSMATAALRGSRTGGFVELGLGRGYMLAALLEWQSSREERFDYYHVFDRPATPEKPAMYAHDAAEIEDVFNVPSVEIFWGDLPESLDQRSKKVNGKGAGAISFVHVDLNNGEAEIECLNRLVEEMAPNCVILFDDSGNPGCREQADLHAEWCRRHSRNLCFLPSGQAVSL